jgi:hypothetical protein
LSALWNHTPSCQLGAPRRYFITGSAVASDPAALSSR